MERAAHTVHVGKAVRDGVAFDFKNPREEILDAGSLPRAVNLLFALLDERRIDYLLVGGVALLQYVEGRNTQDVDLIVAVADLGRLPEIEVSSRDADFARVGLYENDVATLVQAYQPDLDPIFAELSRHLSPTDLAAVRDAVADVLRRIERFRQRGGDGA